MRDAIFDLDGTIIDSAVQCAAIGRAMLFDRGARGEVPMALVKRLSSRGGRILVAGMLGDHARCADADLAEFRARYAETPTPVSTVFPGVLQALHSLRNAGIRLSICSAKPQALCEQVLADVGLTQLFAAIVGSDAGRACKPDPAHYYHLRRSLIGSEAAVYVGDSEVDAAFADALGIPLVMVPHGYAAESFDWSRRAIAHTFADVPAMVLDLLDAQAAEPPVLLRVAAA